MSKDRGETRLIGCGPLHPHTGGVATEFIFDGDFESLSLLRAELHVAVLQRADLDIMGIGNNQLDSMTVVDR